MVDSRDPANSDRAARIERQLAAAQQITHIGSWEWDARTNAVTMSCSINLVRADIGSILRKQMRRISSQVASQLAVFRVRERV